MASSPVDSQRAATIALAGSVVLVVAMLVVGALGQGFIFEGTIGRLELEGTDWVARHRIGVLDPVATVGSSLTDTWTVIGVAFGASVILWVTGNRRHASLLPIGLAVELAAFLAVSTIIGRERPDVTPLGSVPSTASFPSGHVAAGVVLYGGLALIAASLTGSNAVTRGASIPAAVVITYVATARIYEGVHHPTDVVGGALLGIGALFVAASSTGLMAPARRTSGARASGGRRALKATGP